MIAVVATVLGIALWAVLFALPREGFWPRAVIAGPTTVVAAVGVRAFTHQSHPWFGSTELADLLIGLLLAAVAWAAVRWGYGPAQRLVPRVTRHADELFALRDRVGTPTILAGVVTMGVAEELLFRGLLQPEVGLLVATAVYAGVQLITRNPLLLLLGLIGGLVWGGLYAWTGSLVPGMLCHVLPIAATAIAPPPARVARARS